MTSLFHLPVNMQNSYSVEHRDYSVLFTIQLIMIVKRRGSAAGMKRCHIKGGGPEMPQLFCLVTNY